MTAAVMPKAIKTVLSKGRDWPSLASLTSTDFAVVVVVVVLSCSTDCPPFLKHIFPVRTQSEHCLSRVVCAADSTIQHLTAFNGALPYLTKLYYEACILRVQSIWQ